VIEVVTNRPQQGARAVTAGCSGGSAIAPRASQISACPWHLRAKIDNTNSICGASCVVTAAADLLRPQPQCPQHWLAPLLAL
jgi:hypothetical protein